MALGFRRPHTPYIAPKQYFEPYPETQMPRRQGTLDQLYGIPKYALTYEEPDLNRPAADQIAAYYASITFMDAQLGFVLDAMDRMGLWDNTFVVFTSDHGYHLGDHGGLFQKMTLFEEVARIPLVVTGPGIGAGGASSALVELVDLFPTLADIAGLPPPEGVEGTSFVPVLSVPDRPWKKAAFTEVSRGGSRHGDATVPLNSTDLGRTIRTRDHRYTEWFDGTAQLYDHRVDQRELNNLAEDASQSELRTRLSRQLKAGWTQAVPD